MSTIMEIISNRRGRHGIGPPLKPVKSNCLSAENFSTLSTNNLTNPGADTILHLLLS